MNLNCQQKTKRTYSSFTKYCYQKHLLPNDIAKDIPRSTRQNWRKLHVPIIEDEALAKFEAESLDYSLVLTEKEKLNELCLALKEIILLYRNVLDSCDINKQLLLKYKPLIIETALRLRSVVPLNEFCAYLNISCQQFYSWKNNQVCSASLLKLCRKKFPSQLTDIEIKVIKTYMENPDFLYLSRATIYWKIIREGAAAFSKTVFYKYCRLMGYQKRPVIKKSKQNIDGIKATKPGEILHTDITYITTEDDKTSYLSFVQDNFSRFILLGNASKTPTAGFIKSNMEQVVNNYILHKPITMLITDNGSENKGEFDTYLQNEARCIKKIIARVDIPQANNIVEALHKKFKNEFLQGKRFASHEALLKALPKLIDAYNNQCHDSLFGLTPLEVWNGLLPDKNLYKTMLIQACHKRKLTNTAFNCCTNLRTL